MLSNNLEYDARQCDAHENDFPHMKEGMANRIANRALKSSYDNDPKNERFESNVS